MATRSFDLVDYKVAETEFFLQALESSGPAFFAAGYYFNAFVAAARSTTFAMQAVLSSAPSFPEWYGNHQTRLRGDSVARFFHEVRRVNQHVGTSPIGGGSGGSGKPWTYYFSPCDDFPSVPEVDVVTACRGYMSHILSIVFDCYVVFGEQIDPHQYYTEEAFARRGQTIVDALEELGGYPLSTIPEHVPIAYVWQMVRDSVPGCRIDDLFAKYLNQARPAPARLDPPPASEFKMPPGWTRKDGFLLPPGYDSIDKYLDERRAGIAPRNW